MIMLILGLLIFLGIHCVGFAPEWRQRRVDSMGLLPWKGLYSLIALAGFVLMFVALLTLIGTMISDLLLVLLDPRIRYGAREG